MPKEYKMSDIIMNWYDKGLRNDSILGGAHYFSPVESATFFKKLLNKPLKLGGARAPPVPRYLDMIEIVKDQRSKNGMENLVG